MSNQTLSCSLELPTAADWAENLSPRREGYRLSAHISWPMFFGLKSARASTSSWSNLSSSSSASSENHPSEKSNFSILYQFVYVLPDLAEHPMEVRDKLRNFVVGSLPTVIYIPDFITESEETELLENVYKAPQSKWKSLKNRRLQNWGGIVHEKGLLPQELPSWLTKITQRITDESGLFPSAINHVLINEYLPSQGIMPHQDGPAYYPVVAILSLGSPVVMDFTPHSSLRSGTSEPTAIREDANKDVDEWLDNHRPFSVALMPRSLLIFTDEAYSAYLHGIKDTAVHQINGSVVNETEALGHGSYSDSDEVAVEVVNNVDAKCIQRANTRISLTCRAVLKVHKKLFKF